MISVENVWRLYLFDIVFFYSTINFILAIIKVFWYILVTNNLYLGGACKMKVQTGYLYHIKDEFFDMINGKGLMINHGATG